MTIGAGYSWVESCKHCSNRETMASVKKRRSPPEMKKMKNDDDQTDCTSGPAPSPDANDVSVCVTAVHSLKGKCFLCLKQASSRR